MSLADSIQAVYEKHGRLTPDLVVEEARPKAHPLHDRVFDKAPKDAAEAYYRRRAHELIQSVRVVYREATETERAESVRVWHAVSGEESASVFVPVDTVASDPLIQKLVLRNMEREWRALHRRYGHMVEFLSIVRGDLAEDAG